MSQRVNEPVGQRLALGAPVPGSELKVQSWALVPRFRVWGYEYRVRVSAASALSAVHPKITKRTHEPKGRRATDDTDAEIAKRSHRVKITPYGVPASAGRG